MYSPRTQLRLSLSLTLALLCGCALTPSSPATAADDAPVKPAGSAADQTSASPQEEAQFHVMAGEMAAGRQQPGVAAREFLKALDYTADPQIAARATAQALMAQDDDLALQAARKWQAIDAPSLDAREVITRLALRSGKNDEAYAECASIVHDHPGGVDDGFHHVALLLQQEPAQAAAAMALMDRLVSQYPKQAGAYQAQGLLALRYGKVDVAERAARQAIAIKPSKEASLLLVGALVKKGDINGADQVMDTVLKNNPDANEVRLGYARLLIESDQRAHGREQLEKLLKEEPGNVDAHFNLGLLAIDDRKLDEAEAHFLVVAKKPDRVGDAEYFLGRVAELRHQPKQALAHYEKVSNGQQGLDAAVRRAAMLAKLGRLDDARTILEALREQFPPLADRFLMAEGEILLEAGAYDDALELYGEALKETPDDTDLLYSRSLVYERMGRVTDSETDLRKILDKTPDDARALNALGYTLAVHTDRLDEADKLVSKALTLTPDDPAVVDSMGWLRFRQGRPQDALPLLQKAYSEFPDSEVAAHLGEVLWAVGSKDQAHSLLTQASKADPDNAQLRDTLKRLGL
ncbi:tetratricopeptide repeat protein [Nevskia soli]|uniref:tetratricopeptide repeat protein n=1 Tax=Nevskia soli TaxID=418856 RepID=UPI0004A77362|nr:tetratricopeptide repeat protein [Nevskia soli]